MARIESSTCPLRERYLYLTYYALAAILCLVSTFCTLYSSWTLPLSESRGSFSQLVSLSLLLKLLLQRRLIMKMVATAAKMAAKKEAAPTTKFKWAMTKFSRDDMRTYSSFKEQENWSTISKNNVQLFYRCVHPNMNRNKNIRNSILGVNIPAIVYKHLRTVVVSNIFSS